MAYDTRQITHGTQEVTYGLGGDGTGAVTYSTGVQKFSPSVDQDSKKIYADAQTHMTLLNAKKLTIDQDNLQYTPDEMKQMGYLDSGTGFTDNGKYPKFSVQRILDVQDDGGTVTKKLEVYYGVTSGAYTAEEEQRILDAKEWLKTRKFTHIYIPTFDQQSIYTAVKKVNHTQGVDVLIVDYFKGKGEGDAFDSYQELGRFVDMVKNQICGEMNIAGIGAAQATATGKLADSAKIARNASTIAMISDKTPEEIEVDGAECGNKKLRVTVNRNGMQMAQGEYIDLMFDGNHILYEQAKQHIPQTPF